MDGALELLAAVSGLLCVWLTVRQNIWCWPIGLIQIIVYLYIFWTVKLYSDVLLQVVFLVLQFHGWHNWLHGGKDRKELDISLLSSRGRALWATAALVGTALLGAAMHRWTDATLPYWDAGATALSLIAQWLMNRKKLESWWLWITVDILSVGIYLAKNLYWTAGLYTVFLVMATLGLLEWRKTLSEPELA